MAVAVPVLVFVAATLGMALLVEPFLAWYYQWAWWSHVLAADGLNHRLSGRSLLRDEPRRFLCHHGLGNGRAQELARLGIETRADLAGWRPAELAAALQASGARGPGRFLERRARVWLQGTGRHESDRSRRRPGRSAAGRGAMLPLTRGHA